MRFVRLLLLRAAASELSCDWSWIPQLPLIRVVSARNGAPTAWQFDANSIGLRMLRVTRTWGVDKGCWDQTLTFEHEEAPLPATSTHRPLIAHPMALVQIGNLTSHLSLEAPSSELLRWQDCGGEVFAQRDWDGGLRQSFCWPCPGGTGNAAIDVAESWNAFHGITRLTRRIMLQRTCQDLWTHVAVNAAAAGRVLYSESEK
ncbi:unnamed protein product [Polarella glacialis]|uniref:Uncharacterized protein n=1 Tax=Polarella glacialis TaxID=89957 RepID=A0A813HWE9_POLGL|nr:unnamed protein product [Polarella glacialis]CAE8645719.1 unnamed protein product [Polarella glacialis]